MKEYNIVDNYNKDRHVELHFTDELYGELPLFKIRVAKERRDTVEVFEMIQNIFTANYRKIYLCRNQANSLMALCNTIINVWDKITTNVEMPTSDSSEDKRAAESIHAVADVVTMTKCIKELIKESGGFYDGNDKNADIEKYETDYEYGKQIDAIVYKTWAGICYYLGCRYNSLYRNTIMKKFVREMYTALGLDYYAVKIIADDSDNDKEEK